MAEYLTSELITRVREEGFSPPGMADADILNRINRTLWNDVFPLIKDVSEEHFVKSVDYTSYSSGILIPARAGYSSIREIKIFTGNSTVSPINQIDLPRVPLSQIEHDNWRGFYFEGNRIKILPDTGGNTGTVRVYYFFRPSEMVDEGNCAKITALDTTLKTVTVSSVPAGITTSVLVDFVQGKPQFDPLAIDQTISSIVSTTITFSSALPDGLAVNDWVTINQQSPVPQIPLEAFDLLVYGSALRLVRHAKDPQGYQMAQQAFEMEKQKIREILSPRADGAPLIFKNNSSGYFRP